MKLVFKIFPLTTNKLYAHVGRRRFLTKTARDNKEAIGWEARTQYQGLPLAGLVSVSVAFYYPDRRRHDIDNIKSLFDVLSGIVWEDDSQIVEMNVKKAIDKKEPRVEVGVEKYKVI